MNKLEKQEACQLFIEQEIERGLAEGKTKNSIGNELAEWVEELFSAQVKPKTIAKRAERFESNLVRQMSQDDHDSLPNLEDFTPEQRQIIKIYNESKKAKRMEDRERRDQEFTAKQIELPEGKFSLIYLDPPWRYEFSKSDSREIENQYPTLTLDEIKSLPVPDLAADDCVMFMWATSPKLEEALEVINSYGFDYKTCAVWDKQSIGMGYYFRQQHELLLVATKGKPLTPDPSVRVGSLISGKREKHSAKPRVVYYLLEQMFPDHKKVELFARDKRSGWERWGYEAD